MNKSFLLLFFKKEGLSCSKKRKAFFFEKKKQKTFTQKHTTEAFRLVGRAILLVGGSKSGTNEKQFYRDLIRVADERFNAHLGTLAPKSGGKK